MPTELHAATATAPERDAWKFRTAWTVAILLAVCVAPILWELAVGWAQHLGRISSRLRWDRGEIALGLTALVLLLVVSHRTVSALGRMFHAGREWPLGRTLRILGLLFALSTVGIALLGLVHQSLWVLRAPVPMVRMLQW